MIAGALAGAIGYAIGMAVGMMLGRHRERTRIIHQIMVKYLDEDRDVEPFEIRALQPKGG